MSRIAVEHIVGRLIVDAAFRQSFRESPAHALASYELSAGERETMLATDLTALDATAGALDVRLSKSAAMKRNQLWGG